MDAKTEEKLIQELRERVNDQLAAIQLLTPLVQEKGGRREMEYLSILNRGLYQLVRTISHMELASDAPPAFRPQLLDVAGLVRDLVRQLEGLPTNVTFRWKLERTGILTMGDNSLLEEALFSLVANAVKAAGDGGLVQLEVERRGAWALISVRNSGSGLPLGEDKEDALFRKRNGVGLGLAAARRVAELHGGSLVLESRSNGVRAIFSLPVRQEERGDCLRTPVMGCDIRGGLSPVMVELSSVLPNSAYQPEELD